MPKTIVGLGNPGPAYDATRHNVGWWVVDRIAYDWDIGPFARSGRSLVAEGVRAGHDVELVKPQTWMNASGAAVAPLRGLEADELSERLLVIVDDATRPAGSVRFRGSGGAGGHNGLKSVIGALGTDEFCRLRVGVGTPPAGVDLADWVLSAFDDEGEERVVSLLPELAEAVECWMVEGIERAMDRYNR